LTEQGKVASEQLFKEVKEAQKDYAHDSVKKKQAIRQILKKKKIRPWANTVVLGVQALVLLLLYQVFIGGINTEAKLHLIYPGIMRPDFVNTKFLWFDIGQINYPAAAIAAGYLFFEMMLARWDQRNKMSKRERVFLIFFPLSLFLALAILPSVKSIFILTTLVFSTIISLITMFIKYNINQSKLKKK
jgi:membrane protein insertase Oxa1/YidC/SpoIIIJ